ncbi:MAG TPA: D-alanyl-D-alanine carboxypeptidase, partial [Blastocatellia bacterium]
MEATRLLKLRLISALIIVALISSMALAAPAKRTTRSKKATASKKATPRSSKKAVKSKSRGKVTARASRSSRSKKVSARKTKKGRRATYARSRSRSRWRARPANSAPSARGSKMQNYLMEAWTQAQGPNQTRSSTPAMIEDPSGQVLTEPLNSASTSGGVSSEGDMVTGLAVDPATGEPVISNPLVGAYIDSLGARGFSHDNQGLIITTLNGEVLAEHNADKQFNPASVTKVATSLTVISRLGPDFKFRTTLYTDGALDPATGVLNGSLYIIGSGDPAFFYENAILIADKLNRNGIREVNGNLNVLGQFYLNFSTSREASAKALRIALDPATWNAAARGSYSRFLAMRAAEERMNESMARQNGETYRPAPWPSSPPSLKISGETITSPTVDTTSLKLIAVHTSLPLVRLLKGLNDFSNNWMAHVIGNLVGGPDAVERFLVAEVGFKEDEATFATSTGLGANYISPR